MYSNIDEEGWPMLVNVLVKCATIRASICSIGRSLVLRLLERYASANRLLEKRHKENDKYKRLNTAKLRSELKRFDLCIRSELYEMFSTAAVDLTKNPMVFSVKLTELTRIVDNEINISLAAKEFEDTNKWDTRCENLLHFSLLFILILKRYLK